MSVCKLLGSSRCVCARVCLLASSLTVCQKSFLIVVKRWQARVSLIYHSPSTHTDTDTNRDTHTKVGYVFWQVSQLLSDSTLVSELTELYRNTLYVCKLAVKSTMSVGFYFFCTERDEKRREKLEGKGRRMQEN